MTRKIACACSGLIQCIFPKYFQLAIVGSTDVEPAGTACLLYSMTAPQDSQSMGTLNLLHCNGRSLTFACDRDPGSLSSFIVTVWVRVGLLEAEEASFTCEDCKGNFFRQMEGRSDTSSSWLGNFPLQPPPPQPWYTKTKQIVNSSLVLPSGFTLLSLKTMWQPRRQHSKPKPHGI